MSTEISTNKVLLKSKPTESRRLAISNLPDTATEEKIKECFQRHGRIQSIRIDDQRFAFIAFLDRHTASKAHHAENILDEQQLRTAFHDGSNLVPKVLLEASPVTSSTIEPSLSSPSSITTVTNKLTDKPVTTVHKERDKHTSRTVHSPRHQVVPIKRDIDSSRNERRTSLINNSKITSMKSSRSKHENSSSSSRRSHDNSSSYKHASHVKRTRILKLYHLPSNMSSQSLIKKLRNIFSDFKKSSHLLTIKIIDDCALLTFQKSEDVDKALLFVVKKSINGIKLKAEPYYSLINENNEHDLVKRSKCSDLNIDEYSVKATRTLYIDNLRSEVSYNELREIYSQYGDIIEIEIKRQQQPSHTRLFAFIQYRDIKSVVKAMKASESRPIPDHSVKLGFGKSQPTNVLWLDNLPANITDSMLRSFLNRLTNLTSDEILDIYIDNRTCQKDQIVQCLIYFVDVIAAQIAINSIRGKKLESKRIQVDFASKVFLTRFSDIIQQTNSNKKNDRGTNRSHPSDRRYSKVSDAESSLTPSNIISSSRNQPRHRSSSSSDHSSMNQRKLIKSDTDNDTNTERIFNWLMLNHHSNVNNNEEENPVEKLSIQTKKQSNEINFKNDILVNKTNSHHLSKKIFQTKNIPLESDLSFNQFDIRLKVYSSMCNQSINSIHLPLPQFAKTLIKTSNNNPIVLNPKAHLKRISLESTKQEFINEDISEFDERIRSLDKQIYEINRKNSLLSSTTLFEKQNQKIPIEKPSSFNFSPSALSRLSEPAFPIHTNIPAANYKPMSSTTTFHSSIPSSFISPPPSSSTNRLSPSTSNDKSIINPPSLLASDTNNHSPKISSIELLERFGPSAKLKHKPIAPPLSVITTFPIPSTVNDSPIFPTPKSITPSSISGNQNYSPASTSSPITQQIANNSPRSTVLKSALKQPSNLLESSSNQTRKTVHIISTNSPVQQTPLSVDKKKPTDQKTTNIITNDMNKHHQTEEKKLFNPSITSVNNNKLSLGKIPKKANTKPIETTPKSSPKIVKEIPVSPIDTKVSQSTIKHLDSKSLKSINHPYKIPKTNIIQSATKINKTSLLNTQIIKHHINKKSLSTGKKDSLNKLSISKTDQKLVIKSNHNNKISKNKLKLKQNICMYDRIKKRSRNERIQNSLLSTKDDQLSKEHSDNDIQPTNIARLKRHNTNIDLSQSENDEPTKSKIKTPVAFDSNIFDTEENDNKKKNQINHQQIKISKPNNEKLIPKKQVNLSKTNSSSRKRPIIHDSNGSSKKIKLHSVSVPSINKEKTIKNEMSSNNTLIENAPSIKVEMDSINHHNHSTTTVVSKNDDHHQSISVTMKEEPTLDNDEASNIKTIQISDPAGSNQHEQITSVVSSSTITTQQDDFDKQQISNQLSFQILTDKSTKQSIENPSTKEIVKVSEEQISQSSSIISKELTTSTSLNKSDGEALNLFSQFLIDNVIPSDVHQVITIEEPTASIPVSLPISTESSWFPTSATNETLNLFDSRPITNHKHPSLPMHLFPQILNPDSNLYTSHHQQFPYPLFTPPPPDSPPLSTRKLSSSSCSSIAGNSFYNTIMSGQQYCHDKEFRRDSVTKFSNTSSSSNRSTPNNIIHQQQYLGSDSIPSFRNPSELYNYASTTQQMLNSFYFLNDIQSLNRYNIQWEGYIILKTDQAYIKTQLIFGNPQIARISINYWNSDLNDNLRISQRMRLEEIQLDGVQKHMQIDNDYCILIAEPNGLTPDEIRSEQNHLKNGVIQYLNEKKAAGIINILFPGILQPVYVVHIFPPCQFASGILQKRAPDAYRCIVQNKIEQIYLLFIITTTVQ